MFLSSTVVQFWGSQCCKRVQQLTQLCSSDAEVPHAKNANCFIGAARRMRLGWVGMEGVRASSSSWAIEMGRGHVHQQPEQSLSSPVQPCKRNEAGPIH